MASDRALKSTLPGLIKRLNDINVEILALAQRQHILNNARLVCRRRKRTFTHPARTRPANFTKENFLPQKRSRYLATDLFVMGHRVLCGDREILPIRQNMDCDEIDGVRHVAIT